MGYLIAAYAVVIGTLVSYGLWIRSQRRALERETGDASGRAEAPPDSDATP